MTEIPTDEPAESAYQRHRPAPGSWLRSAAVWMYIFVTLTAIGTAVAAIALFTHTGQHCVANPYNDVYGTDVQDCTKTHPFVPAGLAVALSTIIQTTLFAVVGRLCNYLDATRKAQGSA